MAKVPNIDRAVVDPRKVTHYLLDPAPRIGGSKSRLLMAFGFSPGGPRVLIDALIEHGQSFDAASLHPGRNGTKYVVRGCLRTPDGRGVRMRTVWVIDVGDSVPRLVTAVPD